VTAGVVHIVGVAIEIGPLIRQRCSWCGAVLVDCDLRLMGFEERTPPEERRPATWTSGGLVEIDGNMTTVVDHEDGAVLPANSCGLLDPAVTA